MATTITVPNPYSSIKYPVIFGIDRPMDTSCEVAINGYTKRLTNDARSINVAQYYREEFDVSPNIAQTEAFQRYDPVECQRVVDAFIIADGVRSGSVRLVCADHPLPTDRILSDLHRRRAAPGDVEEFSVLLSAPAELVCGAERIALDVGMTVVGFRVSEAAPAAFTVRLEREGVTVDQVEYRLVSDDGVRLAWINIYGAIDFWRFDSRRKTATKITKEKIYAATGYIPTSIKAEVTQSVCTQPQSEHLTATLAQIFVSERAWLVSGGKAHGIDITNETTVLYEEDQLSAIQVEYRTNIRKL